MMGYATKTQTLEELDSNKTTTAKTRLLGEGSREILFNRIAYLYIRDACYNLLFDFEFERSTDLYIKVERRKILEHIQSSRTRFKDNLVDTTTERSELKYLLDNEEVALDLYEKRHTENRYIGICVQKSVTTALNVDNLETSFISHLLRHLNVDRFCASTITPPAPLNSYNLDTKISDLFSSRLRFSPKNDQWHPTGEKHFQKTVRRYTSRGLPIEFVLPAFPCKSSALGKVVGKLPDAGEYLAILNLIDFCLAIQNIYEPGAILWIVSDGHVFSDCGKDYSFRIHTWRTFTVSVVAGGFKETDHVIYWVVGVDDEQVDQYNSALREMSLRIPGSDCIKFISLRELIGFHDDGTHVSGLVDVNHPIATKISIPDENSRATLAATCQPSSGNLRKSFENPNSGELRLYRGLSKFMLQDLATHPNMMKHSKTKRKKLATQVAFEMVVRNQAYSNLVELFFPTCVRLSIHAHSNCGPKFGISLMPKEQCRVITGSAHFGEGDHHIPTPWHNCVAELENPTSISRYVVVKAEVIRQELRNGRCSGSWTDDEKGLGGRFIIDQWR